MKNRIILAAAENGALPGGKVGGIGDVIRDLPVALAKIGWRPTVITPSYGVLHTLPATKLLGVVEVAFASGTNTVNIYRVAGPDPGIQHVVLEHARMSAQGPGHIYTDDGPDRPFATDGSRFAFFSAAVAAYVCGLDDRPHILHLHDWHAGLVTALRQFDPTYALLREIRTVFTIHNLALQGIRPLAGDESSLAAWYPDLDYEEDLVVDPRYPDCVNPMATAIRLADKVSTVSPTYAKEIRRASNPKSGFNGGEGLQKELQNAFRQKRLSGILNGCNYPQLKRRRPGWRRLLDNIGATLSAWSEDKPEMLPLHVAADARLKSFPGRRPRNVLVSVGRLTTQKVALFLQETGTGSSALEAILDELGNDGVFIMLGSGDRQLEHGLATIAAQRRNFAYLCGYSDVLSDLLYRAGDLFLMPSSFEPCGISQMLAMRAGQPCVVHAVGGLKDTVRDGETGFLFDGKTPTEQAGRFVAAVRRALLVKSDDAVRWTRIRTQAAAARFSWDVAARQYENSLYDHASR